MSLNHKKTEQVDSQAITIIVKQYSRGYCSCSKDIKAITNKFRKLLQVVDDWVDDTSSEVVTTMVKNALDRVIPQIVDDVEMALVRYRIVDEDEQSELTKEITELINNASKFR